MPYTAYLLICCFSISKTSLSFGTIIIPYLKANVNSFLKKTFYFIFQKTIDKLKIIEKAIENCNYQVYVKKTLLDDFCISDCYAILEANGFRYTNFIDEFLIEW